MATNNHYVPCFISGNWGTRRSAELYAGPDRERLAAEVDFHASGARRKRFLCLLRKGASPRRMAKQARKVFCKKDLYTLPAYEDPRLRGIQNIIFAEYVGERFSGRVSMRELEAMGTAMVFDRAFPEEHAQRLEEPARRSLDVLRGGGRLNLIEVRYVLKFLGFSYFRTDGWLSTYVDAFADRTVRQVEWSGRYPEGLARDLVSKVVRDAVHILMLLNVPNLPTPYQNVPGLSLEVVVPSSGDGFVLGDHPLRPFGWPHGGRPWQWAGRPRIGLGGCAQAVFPFDPKMALRVSNRAMGVYPPRHHFLGAQEVRGINTYLAAVSFNEVVFPTPDFEAHLIPAGLKMAQGGFREVGEPSWG